MHAHADRDSRSVRRAIAALFKRAGKKVVHEGGLTNFVPLPRLVRTNSRERGYKGVIRRRDANGVEFMGLKNHRYSILSLSLSLCNGTASPVVVVSLYSSTLSDVTDVA
jgi:hypothetical protein